MRKMKLEYTQPIKIGEKEEELKRTEVFGEDWIWNRAKFYGFILGCLYVAHGLWTHDFRVFPGQQVDKTITEVKVLGLDKLEKAAAEISFAAQRIERSPSPVPTTTPVARPPVQSAPRPAAVAVTPPPAKPADPTPPPRPAPKSLWEMKQNQ